MDQGASLGEEFQLLREHLAQLSDRRHRRGLVHPLEGVLSLTVLGLMCGSVVERHPPVWGHPA